MLNTHRHDSIYAKLQYKRGPSVYKISSQKVLKKMQKYKCLTNNEKGIMNSLYFMTRAKMYCSEHRGMSHPLTWDTPSLCTSCFPFNTTAGVAWPQPAWSFSALSLISGHCYFHCWLRMHSRGWKRSWKKKNLVDHMNFKRALHSNCYFMILPNHLMKDWTKSVSIWRGICFTSLFETLRHIR